MYIEDSLGERIWVDSSHCKNFVDNIQTAFGTRMPPKSMLLQADTGRSGGDLSAGVVLWKFIMTQWGFCHSATCLIYYFTIFVLFIGSSPHPSTPDEDDSQTELLIAEEKLSPEDEGQVMPRYKANSICIFIKLKQCWIQFFFLQSYMYGTSWLKHLYM